MATQREIGLRQEQKEIDVLMAAREGLTDARIGERFGVTSERIRQIRTRAKRRFRLLVLERAERALAKKFALPPGID